MSWFEKIKEYYLDGRWPLSWVRNAVKKGKITEEEFKEITGEDYAGNGTDQNSKTSAGK